MRKFLVIAGVLAACVQIGGTSRAESWEPAQGQEPAVAEAVLWEGVSALYHFAADPHHPFREELASDYLDDVLEFERQLKLLKAGSTAARDFDQIDRLWKEFTAAGAEVIARGSRAFAARVCSLPACVREPKRFSQRSTGSRATSRWCSDRKPGASRSSFGWLQSEAGFRRLPE